MIKIIVLFVSIFIIGCSHTSAPKHSFIDDEKCEELKNEIYGLMDECKSCNTSDDCFLDEEFRAACPFGCYYIRSHKYDHSEKLKDVNKGIDEFGNQCSFCLYECIMPPKQSEIGCMDGKCIDLRFIKEKINNL